MSWVLKYAFPVNQFSVYHIHGKDMYLANDDNTIRQWSIQQQKTVGYFVGHGGTITSIEYCDDLDVLLSTSTDGTLLIWYNGKIIAKYLNRQRKNDTFGSPLYSVCYSARKETAFVGSNAEILAFNVRYDYIQKFIDKNASGHFEEISQLVPYQKIKLHSQIINKLLIAGDKLVSVSYDHTIGITRLDALTVNKLIKLKLGQGIASIAFDKNQQILLVGSIDGKLYAVSKDGLILEGNDVFLNSALVAVAPDAKAKLVWAISSKGQIKLLDQHNYTNDLTDYFDTLKERPIIGLSSYVYFGVHFEESTKTMNLFLNEHYVLGFNFDPNAARVTIRMPHPLHDIALLNFTPLISTKGLHTSTAHKAVVETLKEGTYLIGGGQKTFCILTQETKYHFMNIKEIQTHSKITVVAHSQDFLGFGDDKGYVYYLKTASMQYTKSAAPVSGSITSLQFIGEFILVTTIVGSWHMIALTEFPEPGEEKRSRMMAHNGSINDSVYSKETGILVTAGSDGLLKTWCVGTDLKKLANTPSVFLTGTGNVLAETGVADMRKFGEVTAIVMSADEKRIVTAHGDRQIRVWTSDIADIKLLVTIPCAGCAITALALDNRLILAGLDDKTIRAFNLEDGKIKRTFIGHKDTICSISAYKGIDYYASSSWDGALKLWSKDEERIEREPTTRVKKISTPKKEKPVIMTPIKPQSSLLPAVPNVSLYEKRKQEMERRRRREKAEIEATHRTQLFKDIKALTKMIEESLGVNI